MTMSTRSFGIELECILPLHMDRTSLASALRASHGLLIRQAAYGAATATCWKMQPDRSTGWNGVELVSPVLYGEAGIAECRRMADALLAAGCTVNTNTGFHVHFGASELDVKSIKNLTKMYVWFETFFDHIMPKSRRATNCSYIKSNRADNGGYGTPAVNRCFDRIDAASSIYDVMNIATPDRYRKLNVLNLKNSKGTVEFRQHSGTVEADKVENWVRLLDAFVTKALTTRIRRRKVARDLTPVEEMRLLFGMIEVEKPVQIFYMNRRKEIAKAEAAALRRAA